MGKKFTVSVVYGKDLQSESEMFSNKETFSFLNFMSILGERIKVNKWDSFSGKFNYDKSKKLPSSLFIF